MKIAFLSPSADKKNGWGEVASELCLSYFNKHKSIDFEIFLPEAEKNIKNVKSLPFFDKINFTLPKFTYSFIRPGKFLEYYFADLGDKDFDLIHCSDFPYAFYGYRCAKKKKIPLIITLHGTFYRPVRKFFDPYLFKKTYNYSKEIVAPSHFTNNEMCKYFGIAKSKTNIIHNGVNYDRFNIPVNTDKLKERYGHNKRVILGVGALKDRKGFDIVIKAMQKVRQSVSNAIYIIVGAGTDEDNLKQLVADLGLESTVFFAGKVSDEDLPSYFQFCDIYCHTPRYTPGGAFEGFGIVYLQAGAAGKPVVGSKSGGVPDAIVDGKTGILVPEDNIEATADALIGILKNEDLAKNMGQEGKKYSENHRWRNIAGQYLNIYRKILQK